MLQHWGKRGRAGRGGKWNDDHSLKLLRSCTATTARAAFPNRKAEVFPGIVQVVAVAMGAAFNPINENSIGGALYLVDLVGSRQASDLAILTR